MLPRWGSDRRAILSGVRKYRLYREQNPKGEFLGTIELEELPDVGSLLVSGEVTWRILKVSDDEGELPSLLVRLVRVSEAQE